jgi:coproporphyrinogen III oxidase-like Fe-S oxidoreductase
LADDTWMGRRTALHDRFLDVAQVGDASRLAFLNGPTTVWTEEEVAAMWTRALRSPIGALPSRNCLYIHVPFCKSICSFCNYDRLQPSSPDLLKTWLARVLRSIEVMAPAVRPLTFHALYLGGGTPSVLPARLLSELLTAVDTRFSWHRMAARTLEFDPAVMNRERLEVLAAHGFKKLSFGIQTLEEEINVRHNRGRQGIETIERSFADLRAVGIPNVACDFLLGLEGTTPEGILAEMETVIRRFHPAALDIFMLTPTRAYVDRHFGGSMEAFWAHIGRFEAMIPAALPALAARTGYVVGVGHGHHMVLRRQKRLPNFLSRYLPLAGHIPFPRLSSLGRHFTLPRAFERWDWRQCSYTALTSDARRPVNLLGLGRSARSVIFGTAAFAACDPGDDPTAAGAAHYEGHKIDIAAEARSFLVHLLRDHDTVDRAEFQQIFGGDMTEIIAPALAAWAKEGTAQLEDDVLRLMPQERRARTRSLLWLVPEEAIEFDLAHFNQLELSPAAVAQLVAPIKPGTRLVGGHTFEGSDGICLLLRTPEGQMLRMRVAPGLTDASPIRLVIEDTPTTQDIDGLRRAVGQLRGLLTFQHRRQSGHPSVLSAAGFARQNLG